MSWQFPAITIGLLFSAGIATSAAFEAWRRRSTPGSRAFSLMMLGVALYAVIATLEMAAPDIPTKVLMAKIEYFGIAGAPVVWLLFVALYTRQDKWVTPRNIALFAILPCVTIALVWTNELHGWHWSLVQSRVNVYGSIIFSYSFWFYVHVVYSYVLMTLGVVLLFLAFKRSPRSYRRQAVVLSIGVLVPVIGSAVYSFRGMGGVPEFDWSSITFVVSGLIYAWAIFGLKMFDPVPAARNALLENMDDGVVVINELNDIVDINPAARRLIKADASAIGRPANLVLAPIPELLAPGNTNATSAFEIYLPEDPPRCLDVWISPLYDRQRHLAGQFIVLHDITQRKQLEGKLRDSEELYRSIISASPDAIAITDLQGAVQLASLELTRLGGLDSHDNFVGRNLIDFLIAEDRERAAQNLAKVVDGLSLGVVEYRAMRRDGRRIDVGANAEVIRDTDGAPRRIVFIIRDITLRKRMETELHELNANLERQIQQRTEQLESTIRTLEYEIIEHKRAEQALRQMEETLAQRVADQSRKLAALYEVIIVGGQSLRERDMQERSLDKIVAVLGCEAACMHLLDERGNSMKLVAYRGLSAEAQAQARMLPMDWAMSDDIPITVTDLTNNGKVPPAVKLPGFRAYLGNIIHLQGRPVGALSMFWKEPRPFPVEDIALFSAMADQLGIILENARLRQRSADAAVLQERRRLARDLHDSVTQSLHSLVLSAETASNRLRQGKLDRLETSLAQLAESARQALKEMRLLLFELRLTGLAQVNLVEAIQTRLDAVERRAGIDAQLMVSADAVWPKAWEDELYNIAMEALNNALKHARATRVSVHLRGNSHRLEMDIQDDGQGFDPEHQTSGGMGLRSMAERAESLGGHLTISSKIGGGTTLNLTARDNSYDPEAVSEGVAELV